MDIKFAETDVFGDFLDSPKPIRKPVRIANLADFVPVADEVLIHKATQDLWSLSDDGTISRLFDDNEGPLKG